jgi:hypothetical protein
VHITFFTKQGDNKSYVISVDVDNNVLTCTTEDGRKGDSISLQDDIDIDNIDTITYQTFQKQVTQAFAISHDQIKKQKFVEYEMNGFPLWVLNLNTAEHPFTFVPINQVGVECKLGFSISNAGPLPVPPTDECNVFAHLTCAWQMKRYL